MIIIPKPYQDMSLPELRQAYLDFEALLSRTAVRSSRAKVAGVIDEIATWIDRREREAKEMAA